MDDIILEPFAPNLIESTRSIGYSFETALADIIDNSVSNYSTRVDVLFQNGKKSYIEIIDNGQGMSKKELIHAMRYGSSNVLENREENDLGRFGLGLKMASMSQCRKLTVITKKNDTIHGVCWDLDYIHKTQKWTLILLNDIQISEIENINYLKRQSTGTIILWENLDKISDSYVNFEKEFNEKLDFSSKHLSLVFHSFFENRSSKKYFELYFNNRKLEAIDPYMKKNTATQELEKEILFIKKIPVSITPFITPFMNKLSAEERKEQNDYSDLNLNQGLYIYRNNRLIVWGKWFRILKQNELNRLAKIRIDLPNNIDEYWTIDVKKSNAQIPSIIKDDLKKIIIRAVGKSEKVYKYRGRKTKVDDYEHVWNRIENRGKIQYLINRDILMFKVLKENLSEYQNDLLEGFINSIEDAFPYSAVYYDLAKDEQIEDGSLSDEEVYQLAKNTINTLEDKKAALQTLKKIDLFKNYINIIEKIEEEYINE